MSDGRLLRVAEVLIEAYGDRLFLSADEIRELLEDDEELMTRCLDFLIDRDELFLAAGRSPRFYLRRNVIAAVLDCVGKSEGILTEDLAEAIVVPIAVTCEILGWLERDGRIRAHHRGDDVYFERV